MFIHGRNTICLERKFFLFWFVPNVYKNVWFNVNTSIVMYTQVYLLVSIPVFTYVWVCIIMYTDCMKKVMVLYYVKFLFYFYLTIYYWHTFTTVYSMWILIYYYIYIIHMCVHISTYILMYTYTLQYTVHRVHIFKHKMLIRQYLQYFYDPIGSLIKGIVFVIFVYFFNVSYF